MPVISLWSSNHHRQFDWHLTLFFLWIKLPCAVHGDFGFYGGLGSELSESKKSLRLWRIGFLNFYWFEKGNLRVLLWFWSRRKLSSELSEVLKMESTEVSLNGEGGGGGGNSSKGGGGGGDAFIDRSKVRILVCDNDAKSLEEVSTLLLKCSYQGIYIYCFF